ncbi:hypothetical protein ACFWY9_37965 [Amycolatopsis sp. NPDC059027]|uniref:hypothetical protein n=1 Tax=unclassified Amycolatopsis TaxID=2618356 RepID=UPI00366ECFE4
MADRAVVKMVRDIRVWLADDQGTDDVITCLELLLDARDTWLNCADPTLWRTGDAHRLLIDTAAPRLTDRYGLSAHGPAALQVLIDFLDATDRFHPASTRIMTLRKELDRATARFPAAMADESRWRLAKRIYTAMLAAGVDIDDDDAADAWLEKFNRSVRPRRRAVLGSLLDQTPELATARFVARDSVVAALPPDAPIPPEFRRDEPAAEPCPANPPVSLPPTNQLAVSARESALLRRLVSCGQWAVEGRKVTKQGFPSPADTRSFAETLGINPRERLRDPRDQVPLTRAWRLALDVEVLRLHRTQVVPGPAFTALERVVAGTADAEETLRLWQEVVDVAVAGPAQLDERDEGTRELEAFLRPWGPRALGEMYRAEAPIGLEDLIDDLIDEHHDPDVSETLIALTGAAVRTGLLAAVEAGAATVALPPDTDHERTTVQMAALLGEPSWAVLPILDARAELTSLGRYFVRRNLLAEEVTRLYLNRLEKEPADVLRIPRGGSGTR